MNTLNFVTHVTQQVSHSKRRKPAPMLESYACYSCYSPTHTRACAREG